MAVVRPQEVWWWLAEVRLAGRIGEESVGEDLGG